MRSRGFTLLEILIVVSIIALSYTLLPKIFFSGVSGADLKSNARQVAGGLKLARDAAIYSRKSAFLSLDLGNRAFTVDGDAKVHQLHPEVELKLFTAQDDLVSDTVGTIRFFPDGSSNGGRITVGSGARKYLIDIDWLTGRVTIDEGKDDKA
jgi:general secretion pathway protein H